jgi:hypothetical protein
MAIVGVATASTVAVATDGIVAGIVAGTAVDVVTTVAVDESAAVGDAEVLLSQAASTSIEAINIAKRSGLVYRKVKIVSYQT